MKEFYFKSNDDKVELVSAVRTTPIWGKPNGEYTVTLKNISTSKVYVFYINYKTVGQYENEYWYVDVIRVSTNQVGTNILEVIQALLDKGILDLKYEKH